ncbi:MAG: tetratricopeptide repeat protein, partial [Raineya sp.]|nr:tetratricopeptide repeat protein [Raineya sp.]
AIAAFEQALGKLEPKSKNYAIVMNNLALTYDDMQNFAKAEECYKRAADVYKATVGEKDANYITTIENLGYLYQQQGKYDLAEEYYSQALALNKEVLGTKDPRYAEALESLAKLAEKAGKRTRAEELYIEHLKLQKDNLGEKHPAYAAAMENLAKFYQNEGKFTLAEDYFKDVIKIRKRNKQEQTPEYANTLNSLAILYKVSGKPALAEAAYEEAIAIYKATLGEKSNAYATVVKNLADLYFMQAKYQKAEEYYKISRNIIRENVGDKHPDYALALKDLGKIYYIRSEYAEAEKTYSQAIEILKVRGKNNREYASLINDLANIYRMQGLLDKAEPLLAESIQISKEIYGTKHPDYARSLYNLALLYARKEGQSERVEKMYQEVLAACRDNPADAQLYSSVLNALANIYNNKGDFDKAEPLYLEGLKIARKNLGKKHPAYARSLNNLAIMYRQRAKFEKAIELFMEVAQIRKEVLGEKHLEYGRTLRNIAELYYVDKKYDKAEPYYVEANRIFLEQIRKNFATLSEKEKEVFFKYFQQSFVMFHSFMLLRKDANPNLIEEAYNNQLAIKGIMLSEQNRLRNTILNGKDEELKRLYQAWQAKKDSLGQIYMKNNETDSVKINTEPLEKEIEAIEKQLSLKSALFAQTQQQKFVSFQEVQNALGLDEVAVEIVRFNKFEYRFTDSVYYVAFIVSKNHAKPQLAFFWRTTPKGEQEELAFYRNSVRLRKEDLASYNLFWKPIEQKIREINPNAKKVYLACDGVYYAINPNTLLNPETKKYLLDERPVQIVISTRDVVKLKNASQNVTLKNALLLGYPDYEEDEADGSMPPVDSLYLAELDEMTRYRSTIVNLPGTRKEVDAIEKTLKTKNIAVQKLLEKKANEKSIKEAQSPSILHIDTHGYFLEDVDEDLNETNNNPKKSTNPLMRSGLLLAGVQKTLRKQKKNSEDGMLTAYEAQTLDLGETDLVVLSACETGAGEVRNTEGIFGLQRAFQVAGANAVVTSLWKVDDAATEFLMSNFYNAWLKGVSKYDALQSAMRETRKKYPQPYFWGAFVMVNN